MSVGNRLLHPWAQALLSREQVDELAALLADESRAGRLEIIDDEARELVLEWDRRGRYLVVTGQPVREMDGRLIPRAELHAYPDDPTTVSLGAEQVEELARFLEERPADEA